MAGQTEDSAQAEKDGNESSAQTSVRCLRTEQDALGFHIEGLARAGIKRWYPPQ